jgi:hypothetical protein
MNKNAFKKDDYETPSIQIIEFQLEESIALSGENYPGLACGEEVQG